MSDIVGEFKGAQDTKKVLKIDLFMQSFCVQCTDAHRGVHLTSLTSVMLHQLGTRGGSLFSEMRRTGGMALLTS